MLFSQHFLRILSKMMSLLVEDSVDRSAQLFKWSWCITDLRYVLIDLCLEKLLSLEANVIRIVSNILRGGTNQEML